MTDLNINPGDFTPKINFNSSTGRLELIGTSIPEDAYNFYKPVTEWIATYLNNPAPSTELIFKMEYFNTSSTVFLLRIIKAVGQLKQAGNDVRIQWHYPKNDEDMLEAGKDFGVLAKTSVEFVTY